MPDRKQLEASIATLEAQRSVLGDAVVDAAIAALRAQLAPPTPIAPLRAERKPVTVLFADLSGFTSLSERCDPETVRRVMNACFDALKEELDRYGGHIDKYIGDEVMVLFGAPVACEDHAERALRTALAMHARLRAFNRQLDDDPQLAHLPPDLRTLTLHIGVNSGLVIAGGIGAQSQQQYSVLGDAVNVAARLTDLGAEGQTLVGAKTQQLTAPLFEFEALPPLTLKGKEQPQQAYALKGVAPHPGRTRGLERLGLSAPMVGREFECAQLQAALAQLSAGRGQVLAVVGEAGVGKSRLIAESRLQSAVPWYEGRCLSYGELLTFHPFTALLRNLLGVAPETPTADVATQLRAFMVSRLPDQAAVLYPYLADVLGLSLTDSDRARLEHLAGESRQWQTFRAFEAVLRALASPSPVVIVLEDLHWADPTSIELLTQLLPLSARLPLLFVLVTRPFAGRVWEHTLARLRQEGAVPYAEIVLSPLDAVHSRDLVGHLLAVDALPLDLRTLILEHAEGNPLYLEEIIRALIGQGVLQRVGERWQPVPGADLARLDIPSTLQGVILARLDRLAQETKTVLQMAAVIGRIFWYRVLDYLASVEQRLETMLDVHLNRLEEVELVRCTREQPDPEYIFKHVMIQDAAYHSLLREQRGLFHGRVAEALETIFVEDLEEHFGLLAHHYDLAGVVQKAVHYLRLAGDRARRAYALSEAQDYYRRALELLPVADERRRRLLLNLGGIELVLGRFTEAGEFYAAAFAQQRRYPDTSSRPQAQRPLRICDRDPRSLEPAVPSDLSSGRYIQQLFVPLVDFDVDLNLVPSMAERWEVDASGRRYRFHLRRDARWSDGMPLTAHDFAYGWRYWMQPEVDSELHSWLFMVRGARDYREGARDDPEGIGVHALDDHTLDVELVAPVAYALPLLASTVFAPLPRHAWPPPDPLDADPAALVSNGPFRLADYRPGEGLALERNPYFCGDFPGNVARVEYRFSDRVDVTLDTFLQDGADLWLDEAGLQAGPGLRMREELPRTHWQARPGLATLYCGLMPNAPPLDDVRVRQALFMAIDRQALAEVMAPSPNVPARGGFIPPGIPGHSPELSLPYDPQGARQRLREAGYAGGAELPPLHCVVFMPNPAIESMIVQWERTLGLTVLREEMTLGELMTRQDSHPPHIVLMAWLADYPDPHNFMDGGFVQQAVWHDERYHSMLEEASQTRDVRRRMALYHALDRQLVVEQALCLPLGHPRQMALVQPRVRNFKIMPSAHLLLRDVVLGAD